MSANRLHAFLFLKFKHGDRKKDHRCKDGVVVVDKRTAFSLANECRLKFINLDLEFITMKTQIQKFINDESGATAIEYGLLAALVALGIAAGATALGTQLGALFTRISTRLATAVF